MMDPTFGRLMAFAFGMLSVGASFLGSEWMIVGTAPTTYPMTLTLTLGAALMLVTGFLVWRRRDG